MKGCETITQGKKRHITMKRYKSPTPLSEYLVFHRLTEEDFARMVEVTLSAVSAWATGRTQRPRPYNWVKVLRLVGAEAYTFWPEQYRNYDYEPTKRIRATPQPIQEGLFDPTVSHVSLHPIAEDLPYPNLITQDDVREALNDSTMSDIADVTLFENPDYASAFIGVTMSDVKRASVYDYGLMVEHLMLTEHRTYEEAVEFIDVNTLRSLPYQRNAPIVVERLIERK